MPTANRGFLALLLFVVPSCYAPAIEDGQYTCNDGICPTGFVCTHCKRCVVGSGNVNDDNLCSERDLAFNFSDDGGGQLDGASVDLAVAPDDIARRDMAASLDMAKPLDLASPSDMGGCYCIFSQQLNNGTGGCYLTLGGAGGMPNMNLSGSCPNGCVLLVDGGAFNCAGKMCEPQPREGVNCH